MELISSIGLGVALAVDASVVAFSCGLTSREHTWHCPLKLALITGIFQGLMPAIGFFAAGTLVHLISSWASWIAFAVFLILGATFIRNAWADEPECECRGCARCALRKWKNIFAIGIATSIDALAVGVGMACSASATPMTQSYGEKIIAPALTIAGTTFVCVLIAFHSTRFFRRLPTKLLGTLAGLILIALGIKAIF